VSTVFDVEDANVISRRDDGAVVRVWHELDREDVAPMTREYRSGKAELRCRRVGMVRMDVNAVVVGPGGEQSPGCRPAVLCQLSSSSLYCG
jgi:hypothetical protein